MFCRVDPGNCRMKKHIFTDIHYPQEIYPEELDHYLAKGWFRMGQTIFTCRFITFQNILFSTIWLRLSLDGFQFSKSQRKRLGRNRRRFTIVHRKAVFDHEKEALYQLHKKRFNGHVSKSLWRSLMGDSLTNIYDTQEIAIYDDDQLVGCSFFDRGEKALASIMGIYHPDYHRYSLGYYTMLEEMAFGQQHNYTHYYPGYVVPGYDKFDYKLRIGMVDYFHPRYGDWRPYQKLDTEVLWSNRLYGKMEEAQDHLRAKGIPHQLWLYPLFDKDLHGYPKDFFLRAPLFISCFPKNIREGILIVVYDLFEQMYQLIYAINLEDPVSLLMPGFFRGFDPDRSFLDFLVPQRLLAVQAEPAGIVEAIETLLKAK